MATISGTTKILGVIGDPIEHSMSPKMHNTAIQALGLNYVYISFHVYSKDLAAAIAGIRSLQIRGINVTIPHKIAVMPYVDEIDPLAQKIGAINTIKNENGHIFARNTDGEGALIALNEAGCDPQGKVIVILGAGGAAKAITFYLASLAKRLIIINRSSSHLNELIKSLQKNFQVPIDGISDNNTVAIENAIRSAALLINTTPIGMYPHKDEMPIDPSLFHPNLFVFDIIYNPIETKLLHIARTKGCKTLNGIKMLVNQGAIAFEWWTGIKPDKKLMETAILEDIK
jgi:shikimate dehydrogenase